MVVLATTAAGVMRNTRKSRIRLRKTEKLISNLQLITATNSKVITRT